MVIGLDGEVKRGGLGPGAFAKDHDPLRIAAEEADVALHPFQGLSLILDAIVALQIQTATRQKPEGAQPIIEGHEDDILSQGMGRLKELGAVIQVEAAGLVARGGAARTTDEGAPVNEDHDRQRALTVGCQHWRPDVEVQAVFIGVGVQPRHALRAFGPVLHAPDLGKLAGLGIGPAQVTDGRGRVVQALEGVDRQGGLGLGLTGIARERGRPGRVLAGGGQRAGTGKGLDLAADLGLVNATRRGIQDDERAFRAAVRLAEGDQASMFARAAQTVAHLGGAAGRKAALGSRRALVVVPATAGQGQGHEGRE